MVEYCEVCGTELISKEEKLAGVCNNCSSAMNQDEFLDTVGF